MDKTLSDKPMFSNRDLVNLTIPLIFDALLVIAAGVVDTAMVSSAGEAAVSGVSLVDSLNLLFVTIFNALATGGVVVTSQYIGKGDVENANRSANQVFYLLLSFSLVLTLLLMCFIPQLLNLVYSGIEADVFENARTYFFWILLGYPFLAVGNCCTALMRSMGKNRLSVILTSGYNILNVIGNAILIYGFDMGVAGAAISTSLSRVIFAIAGVWIMHDRHLKVCFDKLYKVCIDGDMLKRIIIIGGGNGIEQGLFQVGKVLVASLVSSLGTIAIAANSVASTVTNIGWSTIGAFSTSLLPIVGQCMGAGKTAQAKMYSKKMFRAASVAVIILFGLIFLLRNQLVLLFSFEEEALREAAYYTGVASLFTILSGYSWSFLPMATFRASGDTKYAVCLAVGTMFAFRVGLAYLLNYLFDLGLLAVWIGMWTDWFCRSCVNRIHFYRGKWMNKKVI
ncbi:MAG: MATE family efflux transporter [Oscillospiraceae bacterium]|nr:MATE family efflux transporter [Oscillospiraceae bacterium]